MYEILFKGVPLHKRRRPPTSQITISAGIASLCRYIFTLIAIGLSLSERCGKCLFYMLLSLFTFNCFLFDYVHEITLICDKTFKCVVIYYNFTSY